MKQPSDCREDIKQILHKARSLISEEEYTTALTSNDWTIIQPILDKAQQISSDSSLDELKLSRSENPLHASDFTEAELEKLKALASEEVELMDSAT